jgi:hypothetical protein
VQEEHRDRAIGWFNAMIAANLSEELKHVDKQAQALKVQEGYGASKEIAMKRFFDKEQSLRCRMNKEIVTGDTIHFGTQEHRE